MNVGKVMLLRISYVRCFVGVYGPILGKALLKILDDMTGNGV